MSEQAQERIQQLLGQLTNLNTARRLFAELNYDISRDPIDTSDWPDSARELLLDDPEVIAAHDRFQVIYAQLDDERLLLTDERKVINKLLQQHPFALFLVSNNEQTKWHFVNVKYDQDVEKRRLYRRIYIGEHERRFNRVRTATERLALLDLETISRDLFGISPLAIQQRHDEAFDVEAVTKSFFKDYRTIFELAEAEISGLEGDDLRLFTQKLFNRLMFIIFLERKGWLQFNGQYDYLQALWDAHRQEKQQEPNVNFYDDRLKLLFFAGLNYQDENSIVGIRDDGFLQTRIGNVPYLNGGLFEDDELDRVNVDVPDIVIGRALNALFYHYNFTVTEATPLDVEVAVDPEMLGKIFEELITGRHESGSYYTPKPIVSFMGREALKGYLANACPQENEERISQFVDNQNSSDLQNPEIILNALRNVTICDPACGSGAYLVGMLHELLDLRQSLFAFNQLDDLTIYQRKLDIIQHNLYGVDVDPFAVNIARLRLWLSLVVDYEGDIPEPLPNLDFKIEVGDSLISPDPSGGLQPDLFRQQQIKTYFQLKNDYLQEHGSTKRALKTQIEDLKENIKDWAHSDYKSSFNNFDWAVEFAEVFMDASKNGGGFDIVVANPPYIRHELLGASYKKDLKKIYPNVYSGLADLFVYFYARALQILRSGGVLAFISSNKFMRAGYGDKLRQVLGEQTTIHTIVDFGDLPVFTATAYPLIIVVQTELPNNANEFRAFEVEDISMISQISEIISVRSWYQSQSSLAPEGWNLIPKNIMDVLEKIQTSGIPLSRFVEDRFFYGIKTGYNNAFVINQDVREQLIQKDIRCQDVIKPWLRGKDVKRWSLADSNLYILYIPWDFPINNYPVIHKYLLQFKEKLEKRPEVKQGRFPWYALSRYASSYVQELEKPKIVYQVFQVEPKFAWDVSGSYINNAIWTIPEAPLYLLGILNSKMGWFLIMQYCTKIQRGYQLIAKYFGRIPIPTITNDQRMNLEIVVNELLNGQLDNEEFDAQEHELNRLVFSIYALTDLEINAIEETLDSEERKKAFQAITESVDQLKTLRGD